MLKEHKKIGIILQVAIFFIISALVAGVITYFSQHSISERTIKENLENMAENVADEVSMAVKEYPSYKWLLRYWYEHKDELEIEYDVDYSSNTETERKARLLSERHPDLQLKYANIYEIRAMSQEDQKLYAEVTYSWLITRINQIKRAYDIDFLFCVLTDRTFTTQEFLFSGADEGAVRGTTYLEVYPLGTTVSVADNLEQQESMRSALIHSSHLAEAGEYVDYYSYLSEMDNKVLLIGLTYNQSELLKNIDRQTMLGTISASSYQLAMALLCLLLIYLFVLRPLKKVQHNIRLYKQSKDSETVEKNLSQVRSHNEIGELSRDVVGLTKEIDDYLNRIETITVEKERIGAELSVASRIQEAMLPNIFPPFPERNDFEIYASMDPAKEVGGDFYDFFMIDDTHIAMVMADVSGKGVPAALFMMVSMILLHQTASDDPNPASVLERVNELICGNNREEMFVSVWLGILDLTTGKITAANAGHEYPMVKAADGHFELIKDTHGFVIGGMEGVKYRDYELQLEPGAKIFLYTDGVPEASNSKKELFGIERTLEALRSAENGTTEDVLAAVNKAVSEFVGDAPQFDDLTMLCLQYNG